MTEFIIPPDNELDCIIFSKDRACQLDLCIRSIGHFAYDVRDIYILKKATSPFYQAGYDKINNVFFLDGNFRHDLFKILRNARKYVLLMCDDFLFYRTYKFYPSIFKLVNSVNLWLGKNITFCYPQNKPETPPPDPYYFLPDLIWDWTKEDPKLDWGYPHGVGGNIYPTEWLRSFLRWKWFTNPNTLESTMNSHRDYKHPLMACPGKSVVISIPNNIVQDIYPNRVRKTKFTPEYLNEKFLAGHRIDPGNLYGLTTNSPMVERDYLI